MKQFKFSFQWKGFILFLIIMLPNFLWFLLPAPNDILRNPSITPFVDLIGSISQALMVGTLIVLSNKRAELSSQNNKWNWLLIISVLAYYMSWVMYYRGITNAAVILSLCLFPCIGFLSFGIKRKN